MKKITKFSGSDKDVAAYFTAIFIPKHKEKLKDYLECLESSVHLGEKNKDGFFGCTLVGIDRFARIQIKEDRIILRIRYVQLRDYSNLLHAKQDSLYIVEQIETLIDLTFPSKISTTI